MTGPHAFSVVICTRNRARLVGRAIASIFAQEYPKDRYELIIIDNGSTDGTADLIARMAAEAPVPVACHLEIRAGVSTARNLGAERARHDYVAFLDDDAAAAPGWLAAFDAVITQHGAEVVGGQVEPIVEAGVAPPDWWREWDVRCLFGLDHLAALDGERVARIRWPLWLGGGNCVYSKAVLQRFGSFRTDLGPTGARRRVAEDIDLNIRLECAGVPIYYAHEAVIHHLVTADRLTRLQIWRRAYWAGRTDAAVGALLGGRRKKMTVRRFLRAASHLLLRPQASRTVSVCRLAYDGGFLLQSRSRVPAGQGAT